MQKNPLQRRGSKDDAYPVGSSNTNSSGVWQAGESSADSQGHVRPVQTVVTCAQEVRTGYPDCRDPEAYGELREGPCLKNIISDILAKKTAKREPAELLGYVQSL